MNVALDRTIILGLQIILLIRLTRLDLQLRGHLHSYMWMDGMGLGWMDGMVIIGRR